MDELIILIIRGIARMLGGPPPQKKSARSPAAGQTTTPPPLPPGVAALPPKVQAQVRAALAKKGRWRPAQAKPVAVIRPQPVAPPPVAPIAPPVQPAASTSPKRTLLQKAVLWSEILQPPLSLRHRN